MEITIKDETALISTLETLQLKPATSLQKIILAVLAQAYDDKEKSCTVKIHKALLKSSSYLSVPSMFAQSIARRSTFPSVQSGVDGEYIQVIAGQEAIPLTFRGRVEKGLASPAQKFIASEEEVPSTYVKRPEILTRSLIGKFGDVRVKIGKNKMIWYIHKP